MTSDKKNIIYERRNVKLLNNVAYKKISATVCSYLSNILVTTGSDSNDSVSKKNAAEILYCIGFRNNVYKGFITNYYRYVKFFSIVNFENNPYLNKIFTSGEYESYLQLFIKPARELLIHQNKKYSIKIKKMLSNVRLGQSPLRKDLLKDIDECLVCTIKDTNILEACHICPVATSKENSMSNIDNFLILCANHHLMFDCYIFSVDSKGRIIEKGEYKNSMITKEKIKESVLSENRKKFISRHFKIFTDFF